MNIFKSSILSVVALGLAATFTACSDDDDVNVLGDEFEVPGAYFKPQYDSEKVLGETDSQFEVPVSRANGEGAGVANIAFTVASKSDNNNVFSIPSQVAFADGETTAMIPVSFNVADMTPMIVYNLEISIADGKETPYTLNSVKYAVSYVPWADLGKCIYTDYFVGTFFGVQDLSYEVSIQEHPQMPGLYRLVNPYGAAYPYNEPGDYDATENHYLYINASDPNAVFFSDRDGKPAHFFSGMNWGYGEFIMTNFVTYYLTRDDEANAADNYGILKDGKIWFPNTLCGMTDYNNGGLYNRVLEEDQYTVILPEASK